MEKDDYAILGLKQSATMREVRSAYLTLAKRYHPDKQGTEREMKLINRAYENITKNLKKPLYSLTIIHNYSAINI